MIYVKQLPKASKLRQLAKEIKNFPITGLGIVQYAEYLDYDQETIDFIRLFSGRMAFASRTDFLNHCALLERLLEQDQSSNPGYAKDFQED